MPRFRGLAAALALAVLAVPLFFGLGRTDLDGDESIYAGVVERMVAGGPWLTPTEENGPFLEKPPLRLWLVAAAMRLGLVGPTETGHRLIDAVMSAGALLFVFLIARGLGGTVSGLGAAFLLITQSPLLFVHGLRSGTMEPLLVLAYCGGVHHFLRWADGGDRRHVAGVAGWCAAAVLVKTVSAVPLLAILLLAAGMAPSWRARAVTDRRSWGIVAALFVAVTAPWFLLQAARHGAVVWHSMFVEHVVTRVTAAVDPTHLQPWWFYSALVADTLKMTWPYIVVGAVVLGIRRQTWPAAILMAAWAVVPILLFSLAASKLGHYVYPALPALAVIGGQAFGAAVRVVGDVRRVSPVSRRVRAALALLVLGALALAIAVALQGRVSVALGPLDVRTASPARPLLAAVAGMLVIAGRRRAALGLLAVALAFSEVDREYGRALDHAAVRRRPLGGLVECIGAHSGGEERRIRVSVGRPLFRDERYYFGRVGWRESWPLDPAHLTRRVRDPERDTPIILDYAQYRALIPDMSMWPPEMRASTAFAPIRDRGLFAILPGRFRPCASAAAARP